MAASWGDTQVLPEGWILKMLVAGETLNIFLLTGMENVMSGGSAACVKFQSWGKFLALNIRCFVVNGLSVASLRCFYLNILGNIRVYWKTLGKKSQKLL